MKTITPHFEKGKLVEMTIDSSNDFFNSFGSEVREIWEESRRKARKYSLELSKMSEALMSLNSEDLTLWWQTIFGNGGKNPNYVYNPT